MEMDPFKGPEVFALQLPQYLWQILRPVSAETSRVCRQCSWGPDIKELLNRLSICRPTTSEANGAYIRDTTAMPVVTDYVRNSKMNQAVADRYQLASNTEDQDTLRNAVREKNTRSHLEGWEIPPVHPRL